MLTNKDLKQIREVMQEEIKTEIEPIKKKLGSVEKKLRTQGKDIKEMLAFLNREDVRLYKRVKRIEVHLDLPQVE